MPVRTGGRTTLVFKTPLTFSPPYHPEPLAHSVIASFAPAVPLAPQIASIPLLLTHRQPHESARAAGAATAAAAAAATVFGGPRHPISPASPIPAQQPVPPRCTAPQAPATWLRRCCPRAVPSGSPGPATPPGHVILCSPARPRSTATPLRPYGAGSRDMRCGRRRAQTAISQHLFFGHKAKATHSVWAGARPGTALPSQPTPPHGQQPCRHARTH